MTKKGVFYFYFTYLYFLWEVGEQGGWPKLFFIMLHSFYDLMCHLSQNVTYIYNMVIMLHRVVTK